MSSETSIPAYSQVSPGMARPSVPSKSHSAPVSTPAAEATPGSPPAANAGGLSVQHFEKLAESMGIYTCGFERWNETTAANRQRNGDTVIVGEYVSEVLQNCWKIYSADRPTAVGAGGQALSAAACDVLAERRRQVDAEGWTPSRDDDVHSRGQLARAAGLYALYAHEPLDLMKQYAPPQWPWHSNWWKPGTARRNLVKAGALVLAEIERIDRTAEADRPTAKGAAGQEGGA